MANYARPDALVSTEWVAGHLGEADTRIVEVDVDTAAYEEGHIPGSVGWNWETQLQDPVTRDLASKGDLESLLGQSGISNETTVILYGDNNNWFAAWALWELLYYGHEDGRLKLMNGGRAKWIAEGRALTKDPPAIAPASYTAAEPDENIRAYRSQVEAHVGQGGPLVDVRSPDEFTGKILAPPGLNETCQRGGHIPGASNIPWAQAVNEDGTFKSYDDLKSLYGDQGVAGDRETVVYCRIGERSSHSWFVLKYLLGFDQVRNYDGSWTEWGNLIRAPIEK
jgi:thiosulfate/3-mercaptopyruvate sulfurtransferase